MMAMPIAAPEIQRCSIISCKKNALRSVIIENTACSNVMVSPSRIVLESRIKKC